LSTPTRTRSRSRAIFAILTFMCGLLVAVAGNAEASVAHHVYRTCSTPGGCGMYLRSGPSMASTHVALMSDGNTFVVNCWTTGPAVLGDPVWLQGSFNGLAGYAMDYYIDTHWNTTQDLTNQGMPQCGGGGGGGSTNLPAVWVGSPLADAMWSESAGCAGAVFPSTACSLPSVHHYSTPASNADFAVDIQQRRGGAPIAGQAVTLYAAPQVPSAAITAKIELINSPCLSGRAADGGLQVIVGFYSGSTRIGSATYAHINPSVSVGQVVSRWGARLGTVWNSGTKSGCWTGAHLHFQMYSTRNYACYNRSWAPYQAIRPTNFLGYTGGNFVHGPRQGCP